MSARPSKIEISGLFTRLDHTIQLHTDERITIVTGPNGSGKTHCLNILKCMVSHEFPALLAMPFASADLSFDGENRLRFVKSRSDEFGTVTGYSRSGKLGQFRVHQDWTAHLPPWISKAGPDRWWDDHEDRYIPEHVLRRRYGDGPKDQERPDWLAAFLPAGEPILIETGRLDVATNWSEVRNGRIRHRPEAVARIKQYAERIQSQVADARRASLAQSQRSDREFAVRALDKARATVKEGELRRRYDDISTLNRELHQSGLTEVTVAVEIPAGKSNPTERRILNLFLDDWEQKLAPLIPVHTRLQLLNEIVGSKLHPKTLRFERQGELVFYSPDGDQIGLEQLSSGEQHLLALYTMLLFAAETGSVVLIDEPEISLHAAWKHAFLDDISRVAYLNELQVVIATHSTGIINGRWDLVDEIGGLNA